MCHGRLVSGLAVAAVCAAASLGAASTASAGTLPPGFQETTAFSGLTNPTVVRFAPDGTVFVAEKSGLIKTFDGLDDPTASVYADLRTQVHNFWDRGLLGMSLDFFYEDFPYVYVTYTHDAAIGGTAPRWGTAGQTSDGCPTPPGPTGDGCVVSGRLSRLAPNPGGEARETVLIEDWCQQYPSHSIGAVEHGPSGEIYVSGGDGASFNFTDWGQDGNPVNPCDDPHTGGSPTPPNAEGGALRSQDLRTGGDPVSLDGTIIRVNPHGHAYHTNPMIGSPDPNTRRIIASGLRNPFRFDVSDDGEIYTGDVGWNTWEEINHKPYFGFSNFGWPCYEGNARQSGYDAANLALCETLYGVGEATPPYYAYNHNAKVVPGESCPTGSSSLAGMRFYRGSSFPLGYRDALFFADYSRDCIWAMRAGADGQPDPSTIETFDAGASNPVWLEVGPDGALYFADFDGGRIRRIQHTVGNQPPSAVADANPRNGPAPLTVSFDATDSSDPDPGDSLSFAWDLDDDGEFDDSSSATPTHTYEEAGSYTPSVRVTDIRGASATATVSIDAGNSPPTPTIEAPARGLRWAVGDEIAFSGFARDAEDDALPPEALDWDLRIAHCPSNCHFHSVQSFPGTDSGSFFAPDHEWRSDLRLRLTATDTGGAVGSTVLRLVPRTSKLLLDSNPEGARLVIDGTAGTTPFNHRVIEGSRHTISAPSPQLFDGDPLRWFRWSDGGAATHSITAPPRWGVFRAGFR